jgi:F-type H+-transporting ATPase subunit delta
MKTNRLVTNAKIDAYTAAIVDNVEKQYGRDELANVRNQLNLLVYQTRSNPKFLQLIKEENLPGEQLSAIVKEVFDGFNPVLVDVLGVMGENHDLRLAPRVVHAFESQVSEKFNLVVVDVDTAVELDDHLRKMVADKVKAELGKDAILNERINKDMLGGIVMTVQGKRVDASVRAQLDKARIQLKKNATEVKASD